MGSDGAHAPVLVPRGARAQQLLQAHRPGRDSAAGGRPRPPVLVRCGWVDEGAPVAGPRDHCQLAVLVGIMVIIGERRLLLRKD